jgi:hypothetical protein
MWEGVSPVLDGYDPIVCETPIAAKVTVLNAGPGTVRLRAWDVPRPDTGVKPDTEMEIRPGGTRVVVGCLVRLHHVKAAPSTFAAVGWRVSNFARKRP